MEEGTDRSLAPRETSEAAPVPPTAGEGVPLTLFRELLMKHEQLLVQYGMVRAGGARLFEYKADAETRARDLTRARQALREAESRHRREILELKAQLRRSELALQDRDTRISDLESKVRTLELLTRNAVTTESIERRFLEVLEKEREVEDLMFGADLPEGEPRPSQRNSTRDH
jgi:hypothetical protein